MSEFSFDEGAKERTFLAAERNQFAAERTFLAWIRTGIACIGGGIAFERLLTFDTPIHKHLAYLIGVLLILLGMGIFIISLSEYEKQCAKLPFKVSLRWRRLVVATLLILSLLFLYLITT